MQSLSSSAPGFSSLIKFSRDTFRLALYGIAGLFFGMAGTFAFATAPVVTYSFNSPSFAESPSGNGYTSFASALAALCPAEIAYLRQGLAQGTTRETESCTAVESTSGTITAFTYQFLTFYGGCPPSGCSNGYGVQIVKFETCPTGQDTYTFAVGDTRCRPAFCSSNVGKYTSVNIPLGTTGTSVLVGPEPPANICIEGCVANKGSGLRTGVAVDNLQYWYFNGEYRFTGIDCQSQPGLGPVTAYGYPTNGSTLTGNAGTGSNGSGSGLSATDSTNIGEIKISSGNSSDVLEAMLEKFNAEFSSTWTDCDQPATCTGDPLQCANAVNLRTSACALGPTTGTAAISNATAKNSLQELVDKSPGTWWGSVTRTVDLTAAFDRPRWLVPAGCPTIPNFQVLGHDFSVSMVPLCDYANIVAAFLIISASLIAYRIIATG